MEIACFAKFIQKEFGKCTTLIVCLSYEIWFKAKINKVKLIFYQPSKKVIVPWAQSPQQFFHDTTLGLFALDGYVLLGSDHNNYYFHPLEF